jgi:16S rRNA (guanine(966)-N(2))-methyltransferase RsmD
MRVISGRAKGRKLRAVPGSGTRPITDRVKENLFNLIQWDVPGSRFLDLFAGTGSVGIEALSRGAEEVVFLDTHRAAISTIQANLAHCQLAQSARVIRTDAFVFLSNDPDRPFDVIYVAPPQYRDLWSRTIEVLDQRPEWIATDGLAVVQIHPKEYRELSLQSLEVIDQRTYGSTMLVFYGRIQEDDSDDES